MIELPNNVDYQELLEKLCKHLGIKCKFEQTIPFVSSYKLVFQWTNKKLENLNITPVIMDDKSAKSQWNMPVVLNQFRNKIRRGKGIFDNYKTKDAAARDFFFHVAANIHSYTGDGYKVNLCFLSDYELDGYAEIVHLNKIPPLHFTCLEELILTLDLLAL